jgi:hypothetical protein
MPVFEVRVTTAIGPSRGPEPGPTKHSASQLRNRGIHPRVHNRDGHARATTERVSLLNLERSEIPLGIPYGLGIRNRRNADD